MGGELPDFLCAGPGLTASSPGDLDAVVRAAYSYVCTDSLTPCYGT